VIEAARALRDSRAEGPPRTSGALFLDQLEVLREIVGREEVAAAIRGLPAASRVELEETMHMSWMRTALAEEVFVAIAKKSAHDVMQLHTRIVRIGVERTLRTLWRMILRFTSDAALIARTPLIYSKTFDRGKLESRIPSPGRAEITLSGWPDISDFQINGLGTGIETVLRVAGRKDARIAWDRTKDGAFYVARWTP
jgi:hypothetical protein